MSLNIKRALISCFALVFLLSFVLLTGCKISSNGGGTDVGNPDPTITNDWDELEAYIKSEFSSYLLPSSKYTTYGAPAEEGIDTAFSYTADSSDYGYSQTNVQEAGVDEADKMKTDGKYIYIAGDNAIHIVDAVPADSMSIVSTINVHGSVDSIYLYNNILVILYNPEEVFNYLDWAGTDLGLLRITGFPYWLPTGRQTGVLLMDISNPFSPERIREFAIDGWMVSSRLNDGKLHIIQQFLPDLPPLQLTYDGTENGRTETIAANELAIESLTIEDLVPYYEIIDAEGNSTSRNPLIEPEDFMQPDESRGGSIVSIVSFDLDNPTEEFHSLGLIADADTVYASTRALYIASSKWNLGIFASENDEYFKTYIYKFSLINENVTYDGTGDVNGIILNQFSLGEYNDVLRIATSTGTWGSGLKSNIYCLEVIDNKLEIIGELEGLAPGEDIYAARFIGTRGFLVTFVKVDPLFTIDLTDPSNPVVAGELKVPGYSDYIHPLGSDHLITIGKDTLVENGNTWYQGLQLSIFDISDFSNPQLLHKELIGDRGTTSEALDNHKAFTFWAENNLLAIPVEFYEHQTEPAYPYTYGEHTFTGLYVYRVTVDDGFEYLGRINTEPDTTQTYYGEYWNRGLFINKDVYAVNYEAVRSAPIDNIEESVNSLFFSD